MQLQTNRLLIRPFTPDDEDAAVALFSDAEFAIWSPSGVLSPDRARAKLWRFIEHDRVHGFSKLALLDRLDGCLLGYCGFGMEPIEGPPTPEFGFRLRADARGKGLATEAARAIIADAFDRLKMPFVQAIVMEGNLPSRRVLQKLGMKYKRKILFEEREWMLYRLDPPT